MIGRHFLRAAIAAALLGSGSTAAVAANLGFTGSVTGISTLIGLDSHCAPPEPFHALILPGNTVGTSNLGNFTYSTDTCLAPASANAPSSGTFTIDFGTDSFSGTFDGGSKFSDTPGISDTAWLFTILSGTGRFLGASGTFEGAGLADARTRPTHVVIGFIGNIVAPAVPEPASWALMLLGFGGIGLAMRRRNQHRPIAQLA
jgi:hypothetical protein